MELAFLTLLLKDGAYSVCGGVAINHEWVLETWLAKDQGGANGVDKGLKCGFMFVLPVEFTTLGAKRDKRIERGCEEAEVSNVHAVKVEKSQECAQFSKGRRPFPIFDAINLDWVHGDAIFADNDA